MATLFTALVAIGFIGLIALIRFVFYRLNLPMTGDITFADLRKAAASSPFELCS